MEKPSLPPRLKLEYIVEDKEYSVEELAATLEESIPFSVLVTKGYTNKNLPYSGLEENKAYRVNCVSRSRRVLATIDQKQDGPRPIYSLSDAYYINMVRVSEDGREVAHYDKIDDNILYIPQFYNKIRMKRVKGIQGVRPDRFLQMEEELNTASGALEFDMHYNQMEMAEFAPHRFTKDIVYANMEPIRSGKITQLFPKHVPSLPNSEYETTSGVLEDHPYDTIGDFHLNRGGDKMSNTSRDYTNNIPRGTVKPIATSRLSTMNVTSKPKLRVAKESSEPKLKRTQSETIDNRRLPTINKADDIKCLSIDEVAAYLDKLRLGSYKAIFKDHLIDGVVLSDLNQEILTQEFGFKAIDAIKLMHFIKDGHVPR